VSVDAPRRPGSPQPRLEDELPKGESLWTDARRRLKQDTFAMACLGVIVAFVLIAAAAWFGLLGDYTAHHKELTYASPSFSHWFGTDVFGRDVFSRVAFGTSIAMAVGLITGVIATIIGGLLGAIAGWYGKWVDDFVVWLYSTVASVPGILLIIGLSYMIGKGFLAVVVAMGLTYWVGVCRIVRGEVLKLKSNDYVLAAKALGLSDMRIIVQHVLPNVAHLLIISFTLLFVQAIKAEVVISFLGVGVVDLPSWGLMIQDATSELTKGYWWQMTFTSLALFAIVLAFQVFGDALRDALDPRLRQ
jgi:peptide/nickel transport system permease protein